MANLRGGGEFGEAWHQAGMLEKKQNVFDDFIAAAEWLVKSGYTRRDRLAIQGGSNGGLLVGAAMTQRPDLFGAVVCQVPLMDMLRYHLFPVGRFWIPEYGSADDPAQFPFLYAYSPYHNVKDGTAYPADAGDDRRHRRPRGPLHGQEVRGAAAGGHRRRRPDPDPRGDEGRPRRAASRSRNRSTRPRTSTRSCSGHCRSTSRCWLGAVLRPSY